MFILSLSYHCLIHLTDHLAHKMMMVSELLQSYHTAGYSVGNIEMVLFTGCTPLLLFS